MSKLDIRREYEALLSKHRSEAWAEHPLNSIWKTNHSLQLTRFGFFHLKTYAKKNNIALLRIELEKGRTVGELLMIANTMNTPYFITEEHIGYKVVIHTLESDRSTMLIMNSGNIQNWANMFKDN